jgi:hypothetical protein
VEAGANTKLGASLKVQWPPIDAPEMDNILVYTVSYAEQYIVFDGKTKVFNELYKPWETKTFKLPAIIQTNLLQATQRSTGKGRKLPRTLEGLDIKATKQGMLYTVLDDLHYGATYKIRAEVHIVHGAESGWSDDLLHTTSFADDGGEYSTRLTPLSWLLAAASCSAVAKEDCRIKGESYDRYIRAIDEVLHDRIMNLRRAFAYYANGPRISNLSVIRMLRDNGLVTGCSPALAARTGAKLMATNDVDLLFQRVLRNAVLPRARRESAEKTPAVSPTSLLSVAETALRKASIVGEASFRRGSSVESLVNKA